MPRTRHTPPYDYQYRYEVKPEFSGKVLIEFFCERFTFKDRDYWLSLIDCGDISVNRQGTEPGYVLQEGDLIHTIRRDVQEPDVNDEYEILYEQDGLLVINKPAPLPVHPAGRYFKNSLTEILKEKHPGKTFHTLHRLDIWTTGVLLLATEKEVAKKIHDQVENQEVKKSYGVLAKGDFSTETFTIDAAIGRKAGVHRGVGADITEGKESVTEFTPLSTKDGITFLKAVPITGRTNQIRVHIQAAGGEILNDPLYSKNPPAEYEIEFMGLHCREMQIRGPSNEVMTLTAPWPNGFINLFSQNELDLFS